MLHLLSGCGKGPPMHALNPQKNWTEWKFGGIGEMRNVIQRVSWAPAVLAGSGEHTCERPQFDTAGDVVVKGDLAAGAVPLRDGSHGLRVQPESWKAEKPPSQKKLKACKNNNKETQNNSNKNTKNRQSKERTAFSALAHTHRERKRS